MIPAHVVQVKSISIAMANLPNQSQKPQLHVAVGIIKRQQQVLLALRHASQHQGDKWEFPGGKVELGETVDVALKRELQEELAITLTACQPFMQIQHAYPERDVLLDIWLVTAFEGVPTGVEGQPLQWAEISQLHTLTFPDANQPIVARLQQQFTA